MDEVKPSQASEHGPLWWPEWSDDEPSRYHLATIHELQILWVFGNDATGCWEFAVFAAQQETPAVLGFGATARDACRWAEREAERRAERLGLGRPSIQFANGAVVRTLPGNAEPFQGKKRQDLPYPIFMTEDAVDELRAGIKGPEPL